MESLTNKTWMDAATETVASYRQLIDAAVEQLSDAELHSRPAPHINSVAIILRHLGGNLHSRWSNFQTSDGEKPDRDRDSEFLDWDGDRESLISHFDTGWNALTSALRKIDDSNINDSITIRGERHTLPQALMRSITHLSYHVGQIAMVARMVHDGEWRWLTIPPGASAQHNERTWAAASERDSIRDDADAT